MIKGYYWDIHDKFQLLFDNSEFTIDRESHNCTNKYGAIVHQIPTAVHFYIDKHEVSHSVFERAINLLWTTWSTWSTDEGIYKELYESPAWEANSPVLKNIKENKDMPKIVDYTYIEHDKVTKIKWSDGSETVVCGSGDDATQFCGYVCAIAKKAMGNNGKMLAEWDRLVVKPVERAKKAEEKKRLAAEKKAEEERIREEAKAKRMAKNAKYYEEREKRRKQREIEALAEQIAKEYEQDKLYAEAMKLAIEKYKVPNEYFQD